MFATIAQLVTLAIVIAAVSSEMQAMLQALRYMSRYQLKLLSPVKSAKLFWHRWMWASPLFHEVYCKSIGKRPAYRISRALYVFAVVLATLELSYLLGHHEISQRLAVDAAVVTAVSYFMTTYGKAFYRSRASVMAQVKANA